jgi:hypothetical protein
MVELTTEAWYRVHEHHLVANPRWSVAWPTEDVKFRKTALQEDILAILRCSESSAACWQDDEGNAWSAFFLQWQPGKNSAQLAKGHRPDICLRAAGAHLVGDFGHLTVPVGGLRIPFQYQTFENGPLLLHVFYCLWSDRSPPKEQSLLEDGSQGSRLQAVMAGKRHLGQQVLELVIQGPESNEEALRVLRSQLPRLIRRL